MPQTDHVDAPLESSAGHDVQFYESEDHLADVASAFLAAGLADREAVIAIVTPPHREAISSRLVERGFDLPALLARGRLRVLDAEETLASFMGDSMPVPERVAAVIGGELKKAARLGDGTVRVFGEMVNLLWRAGNPLAAIRLEELWNGLRDHHDFHLLCAYTMANFAQAADRDRFAQVCDAHHHVVPTERYLRIDRPEARDREVSLLQQRACALEHEIAERRVAEERLRRSEERFRALTTGAPVGIFVLDEQGACNYVNPAWSAITGLVPSDAMGIGWESTIHPQDRERALAVRSCAVQPGSPACVEARLLRRDGVELRAQVTMTRLGCNDDSEGGWIGTIVDITAIKRAEETERALREAVSVQLRETEQLYERIRESDRRKDEFLATLAHELRSPLAPLRNGVELMTVAAEDAGVVREAREMMRRQIDHMVRLVDDLLDLDRISRGKIQLRKGRFQIAHLLDCALETSRPLMERGGHRVSVNAPREPIIVYADATRITQVFANLLNNAAKFTPRGGHVEVDVRPEEGQVAVSVRDYGIGIDAGMLPRVFDMFAQAETAGDGSQGGLGIGLPLAKSLTEMHGGSVEAASAGRGTGSTFTVRLPSLTGAVEPDQGPVRRSASSFVPRSILLVDDNRDAAESLARLLRICGHDVRVASDGEQAIHAAHAYRPAVVILDLGMPRINGYDAARRIRASANGHCPLLIAVTGWGQESDRKKSRDAGFDLHLVKPVDFRALQESLQSQVH